MLAHLQKKGKRRIVFASLSFDFTTGKTKASKQANKNQDKQHHHCLLLSHKLNCLSLKSLKSIICNQVHLIYSCSTATKSKCWYSVRFLLEKGFAVHLIHWEITCVHTKTHNVLR